MRTNRDKNPSLIILPKDSKSIRSQREGKPPQQRRQTKISQGDLISEIQEYLNKNADINEEWYRLTTLFFDKKHGIKGVKENDEEEYSRGGRLLVLKEKRCFFLSEFLYQYLTSDKTRKSWTTFVDGEINRLSARKDAIIKARDTLNQEWDFWKKQTVLKKKENDSIYEFLYQSGLLFIEQMEQNLSFFIQWMDELKSGQRKYRKYRDYSLMGMLIALRGKNNETQIPWEEAKRKVLAILQSLGRDEITDSVLDNLIDDNRKDSTFPDYY